MQSVSDSWRLDTELLLADILGQSREYLFAWPDLELNTDDLRRFEDLLDKRSQGQPVAYLTGRKSFWDFELEVDSRVLIPRPETELLVEQALLLAKQFNQDNLHIADLGTGSGAIAIALARHDANWRLTAVDKCKEALALAKKNAVACNVGNIDFQCGSWCDGLPANHFEIIVANPPYVEAGDPHLQDDSLPYEPLMALVADNKGLGDIERIIHQSKNCLTSKGWLLLEHGFDQAAAVNGLLVEAGFTQVDSQSDLAGIDRITFGQWLQTAGPTELHTE